MTPKEYLSQIWKLDKKIDSMLEELASLKSLSTKITSSISPAKSSTVQNGSRLEETVAKIIEQEIKVDAEIDRLVDLRREASEAIKLVTDKDCESLLRLRYICGKAWPDIAVALSTSERRAYQIHAKALKFFQVPKNMQ